MNRNVTSNGHGSNGKNGRGGEFTDALMRGVQNGGAPLRKRLKDEHSIDLDASEEATEGFEKEPRPAKRKPGRPRKEQRVDGADEAPAPKRGKATKAKEERVIELAPLRMEVIDVEIEGVTDLLQHRWDEKNLKEIRDKGEGKVSQTKAHREFRKPEEEFNGARYIDQKGRDCLPAVQFKKAMAAVAAEKALSGASKASIFRWITVTSLERQQRDLIPIEHDAKKPTMREDMVRVGPFGKRVAMLRYRPSYSNWGCKIRIEFNASVISAEMLCNLLNWAGRGIGIGEWRPEKSGEFGKFCVKQTLNSSKARGN